jgi:hypothetical protein
MMSAMLTGKECFIISLEWDAVRRRCLQQDTKKAPGPEWYTLESISVMAWLPTVHKNIRNLMKTSLTSAIEEAWRYKARTSKHAPVLESEFRDPSVVREVPAPESAYMPTYSEFRNFATAYRYYVYWVTTIIADSILMRLGVDAPSVSGEIQNFADNICKSLKYFHGYKPLGVIGQPFPIATAYGVSSPQQKAELYSSLVDLYEFLPVKITPTTLDYSFGAWTGRINVQTDPSLIK